MIDSLRRITRVEITSPHFREMPPSDCLSFPTVTPNGIGPTEVLELLPLQTVSIDVKCSLSVFKDPSQHYDLKGAMAAMGMGGGGGGRSAMSSTSASGQFFNDATYPAPAPMSAGAASYFLADFGEDNICDAWVKTMRTMILLPFLSDVEPSEYKHQLQQAAVSCPHSITSGSMLSASTQADKGPVLAPQELTGTVANYYEDYRTVVPDPTQPIGTQVLEGVLAGTIPLPTVTFRLDFTVPNREEGAKVFGVMMTLLNSPALIDATPLPLGCLPLGTVVAPAVLDHLLTLSCSSRRIGPNKVLVACKASSRVPQRGANIDEALYRSLFLTNLAFDTPSSCTVKSQGSLYHLPHDPQQRLSATHHTAPLIAALVRSIDVTPLRQAGDFFPITLRKHESYSFVFMLELKPEFAYLAHYAAKQQAAAPPPPSLGAGLPPQHYRRTAIMSKGGAQQQQRTVGFAGAASAAVNNSAITQQQASNNGNSSSSSGVPSLAPVAYGTIGVAAQLHERRLNGQYQAQQRLKEQQRQAAMGMLGPQPVAHQRTGSLFRYKSGPASPAVFSVNRSTGNFMSPVQQQQQQGGDDGGLLSPHSNTFSMRSLSGDGTEFAHGTGSSAVMMRQSSYGGVPPMPNNRGTVGGMRGTYASNPGSLDNASGAAFFNNNGGDAGGGATSSSSAPVGYGHLSHEDLLINHILSEVIETTIVLSYEMDGANKAVGGGAVSPNGRRKSLIATVGEKSPNANGSLSTSPVAAGAAVPSTSRASTPPPLPSSGGTTLSLRWQSTVKWSFNSRQYDARGGLVAQEMAASPSMVDLHNTSADSGWLPYTSPTA